MKNRDRFDSCRAYFDYNDDANDQLTKERGICLERDRHVKGVFQELEECTRRVKAKPYTAETCHQEMKDLFAAVDHCVDGKAFLKLK